MVFPEIRRPAFFPFLHIRLLGRLDPTAGFGRWRRWCKVSLQPVEGGFQFGQGGFDVRKRPVDDHSDNALRIDDHGQAVAAGLGPTAGGQAVEPGNLKVQVFNHRRFQVDPDITPGLVRPFVVPDGFIG